MASSQGKGLVQGGEGLVQDGDALRRQWRRRVKQIPALCFTRRPPRLYISNRCRRTSRSQSCCEIPSGFSLRAAGGACAACQRPASSLPPSSSPLLPSPWVPWAQTAAPWKPRRRGARVFLLAGGMAGEMAEKMGFRGEIGGKPVFIAIAVSLTGVARASEADVASRFLPSGAARSLPKLRVWAGRAGHKTGPRRTQIAFGRRE